MAESFLEGQDEVV